jgi:hypothetical protein
MRPLGQAPSIHDMSIIIPRPPCIHPPSPSSLVCDDRGILRTTACLPCPALPCPALPCPRSIDQSIHLSSPAPCIGQRTEHWATGLTAQTHLLADSWHGETPLRALQGGRNRDRWRLPRRQQTRVRSIPHHFHWKRLSSKQ